MNSLHEADRYLRFEDVVARAHILSGSNKVDDLVYREKEDAGRVPEASQPFPQPGNQSYPQIDIRQSRGCPFQKGVLSLSIIHGDRRSHKPVVADLALT